MARRLLHLGAPRPPPQLRAPRRARRAGISPRRSPPFRLCTHTHTRNIPPALLPTSFSLPKPLTALKHAREGVQREREREKRKSTSERAEHPPEQVRRPHARENAAQRAPRAPTPTRANEPQASRASEYPRAPRRAGRRDARAGDGKRERKAEREQKRPSEGASLSLPPTARAGPKRRARAPLVLAAGPSAPRGLRHDCCGCSGQQERAPRGAGGLERGAAYAPPPEEGASLSPLFLLALAPLLLPPALTPPSPPSHTHTLRTAERRTYKRTQQP